jgi:hypothetical protein
VEKTTKLKTKKHKKRARKTNFKNNTMKIIPKEKQRRRMKRKRKQY